MKILPGFSGSKSYKAEQQGCCEAAAGCGGTAGDRMGEGNGDAKIGK